MTSFLADMSICDNGLFRRLSYEEPRFEIFEEVVLIILVFMYYVHIIRLENLLRNVGFQSGNPQGAWEQLR